MKSLIICIFFALFIFVFAEESTNPIARGWNDNIKWHLLDDGLEAAKESDKPIMIVIHKTWCGACRRLKPSFAASKEIEELSSKFTMINVEDDEEPSETEYAPDGGYIPRVLFATPNGKIRTEVYNRSGNNNYKYFYPDATSIIESMKFVIDHPKPNKL